MTLEVTLKPGEVLLLDGATVRLASDQPCRLSVAGIARPNCPLAVIDLWEMTNATRHRPGKTPVQAVH